ncbi:MAG TPA: hypothetical protein VOA88_08430 [Candidatus Dormibacteraeota bacterium]|nr:hypothetical protein [Candidatus Dormibacteraeota bacterium]
MALKAVGGGRWQSTFTGIGPGGAVYTSEREAAKIDNIESRKGAAAEKGHAILAGILTADMPSVILAMNSIADEATNRTLGDDTARNWFRNHPEFVSHASVEGSVNGAKLAGWLVANHKRRPYTASDLNQAYEALSEAGELYLDESKAAPKTADPADAYVSPLDVMAEHNAYRSFR